MKPETCEECGETVQMEYEPEYDCNTLVGAYVTCPECGHTYIQGRP